MMRNYLCWNPAAVRQVINPFAEHIPDSLFRAVHSDWDLQVAPPVGQRYQDVDAADWRQMTPAEFLADFLRSDRPHALAAILGETGSGKSHLVHWMRLHLRDDAERMVLVVRKSGTSLRAIVGEIIGKLPSEQQRGFLETFNAAGDGTTTSEGRRRELLHHLGQAIREDRPAEGDDVEEALIEALPSLFQDPYMQKEHFLRDGTVAAEIVDHIFEQSHAADRPDRRREFAAEDLMLGGRDYLNATKLAQFAIQVIEADRENLPAAIAVINRNLNKAIARTLSFSGDRVEELMARLRGHLRAQGRELVLLVEEFARLQGIDRALLQAITTQGDPGTGGLCRMRTAIAVTPGFFESVEDTAYRRTTHIVDMNRSAGHADGCRAEPVFCGGLLGALPERRPPRPGTDRDVERSGGAGRTRAVKVWRMSLYRRLSPHFRRDRRLRLIPVYRARALDWGRARRSCAIGPDQPTNYPKRPAGGGARHLCAGNRRRRVSAAAAAGEARRGQAPSARR
jgi:hypothetical protein